MSERRERAREWKRGREMERKRDREQIIDNNDKSSLQ